MANRTKEQKAKYPQTEFEILDRYGGEAWQRVKIKVLRAHEALEARITAIELQKKSLRWIPLSGLALDFLTRQEVKKLEQAFDASKRARGVTAKKIILKLKELRHSRANKPVAPEPQPLQTKAVATPYIPRAVPSSQKQTAKTRRFEALGSYWSEESRFYLPIQRSLHNIALEHGAKWARNIQGADRLVAPLDQNSAALGWKDGMDQFLPTIARKNAVPILPSYIPKKTAGVSLANLLERQSWNTIRQKVFSKRGNSCQLCGKPGEWTGKFAKGLECHEIWEYFVEPRPPGEQAPPGTMGIKRLAGFASVCDECHMAIHPSSAAWKNPASATARALLLNRVTPAQWDASVRAMVSWRSALDHVDWAVDLSLVNDAGPLKIKDDWLERAGDWIEQSGGRSGGGGENSGGVRTQILSTPFLLPGERKPILLEGAEDLFGRSLGAEGDTQLIQATGDGWKSGTPVVIASEPKMPYRHSEPPSIEDLEKILRVGRRR
jgi:hypothetical protein